MNGVNNYKLDMNSIIMIVGILIIAYFLKLLINHLSKVSENQTKILEKLVDKCNGSSIVNSERAISVSELVKAPVAVNKKGKTNGETKIVGVDDDEIIAVIMAAVSHASNISLNSLKIKSIKRVS